MRLPLALILTIFTLLGPVLSVNLDPRLIPMHHLRDGPSGQNSTSSESSTTTSSSTSTSFTSTTSITSSSSITPTSSFQSTTSSTSFSFSSSSESSSSTFTTSSLSPTSTQAFSSTQGPTSTSQSTEIFSPTSSSVTSDSTSTSSISQTRTTFTSTGTDGSLFTVTAIVSGPSDGSGSSPINTENQGFFANTGAVAGTFLVVGLVGTGVFICVFLWALRRCRRRKREHGYFDDEYKVFNQPRERASTPDATLPHITHESRLDTPVPSSPTPNMIERLHGSDAVVPNGSYDPSQYQAQPGEFDPYQNHGDAYAYSSDEQAVYGQYPGTSQTGNMAYAYQPETDFNNHTGQYQAIAEPSHAPAGAVGSLPQVKSNH